MTSPERPAHEAPAQHLAPSGQEEAPGGTASLIFGILGLLLLPIVGSVIAVVMGRRAKARSLADPERYKDTLGKPGRILGWVGIVVYGTFLVANLSGLTMVGP